VAVVNKRILDELDEKERQLQEIKKLKTASSDSTVVKTAARGQQQQQQQQRAFSAGGSPMPLWP